MTREEAKEVFLNRGFVNGLFDGDKWRQSCVVISKWLEQEPCEDWYDVPSDEMTLEQARQAVKDLRKKLAEHLEQEPCEDCISRAEVMENYNGVETPVGYRKVVDMEVIKNMQSVYPKAKTGHWVEYTRVLIPEPINKWEQAWYCSECGYGNQDSDESAWLEWNYCPNCGAKMVEPQESEGKK